MRRGFYGGTFDPIHQGHLQLALFACEHCQLQQLDIIPCHLPPHRPQPTAAKHRVAMVELAIAPYPKLQLNRLELDKSSPSYTVDTLAQLRQQYPDDSLCFLLGMDSLQYFTRWHRYQQILELAHLLVVNRPGYSAFDGDAPALFAQYGTDDLAQLDATTHGRIYQLPNPEFAVSATELRQQQVQDPALQIPLVSQYILQHQLYPSAVPRP